MQWPIVWFFLKRISIALFNGHPVFRAGRGRLAPAGAIPHRRELYSAIEISGKPLSPLQETQPGNKLKQKQNEWEETED